MMSLASEMLKPVLSCQVSSLSVSTPSKPLAWHCWEIMASTMDRVEEALMLM